MTGPTILPFEGKWPKIHDSAFIAPGAVIVGDVEIGAHSSIWYNCVVRGDSNHIRIGVGTNIQDGSVVHCDSPRADNPVGYPTIIGDHVLIGHMVMIHGCVLHDHAFVGLGSIIMDGCVVESDAMLAAGALLTPGKRIPSGQLWSGRPARHMRDMDPATIADLRRGAPAYADNAERHRRSLEEAARQG